MHGIAQHPVDAGHKIVCRQCIPPLKNVQRERPLHLSYCNLSQVNWLSNSHCAERQTYDILTMPDFGIFPLSDRLAFASPFDVRGDVISILLVVEIWLQNVIMRFFQNLYDMKSVNQP